MPAPPLPWSGARPALPAPRTSPPWQDERVHPRQREPSISAAFDLAGAFDLDLAELIPAQYAAYVPLVSESLLFFLGSLPPARTEAIVAGQLALPDTANAAERLVTLMQACPTLHKLGQVVAHDRRLAPALRTRLQALESLPASIPMAEILPLIEREVGRVRGLQPGACALAEGSVAVVLPFDWHTAPQDAHRRGVFKILKPGVAARLQEELELWPALGGFLEQRCAELGLPVVDYREVLDGVRRLLLHEIRLDLEQIHLAAAAERYADAPTVHIPQLLPLSTPRLTAMERIDGVKVTTAAGHLTAAGRDLLGAQLVDALLARPFWSPLPASPFHADPHAGNLMLDEQGRLAILDWSLVVELGVAEREAVVRLVLGALAQDAAGMCRTLGSLGRGTPAEDALRTAVGEALREVRHGRFPGLGWLLALLDRAATRARMRLPDEWIMFRKTLHTLSGVIEDIAPNCPIDRLLAESAVARCAGDLAAGVALASSPDRFGCHRFAGDLFALWLGAPATFARYWGGHLRDWGVLAATR